jgi:hypothetical protein
MNTLLPLSSSVVSFVFAALVFDQWRQRRQSFQLAWTVGLLFYGVSAGTEFIGSAFGWSEPLYRAWYLVGAFYVAAYLGLGTIYLLAKTAFGYFAGVTVVLGGLLSLAFTRLYPGSGSVGRIAFAVAAAGGLAIILATAVRREWAPHLALAVLVIGSLAAAYLVLGAPLAAPGWVLDPHTQVPVGSAFPGYVRVLTGPFNIAGALCLTFGAAFSAYVYMPKRKLLAVGLVRTPVLAQGWYFVAVVVNFFASLPGAVVALLAGRLNSRVPATILIALGGFIPGVTSGLNRFGITWSFFLGELLGVLLIFAGFLVSEEVFANLRLPARGVIWRRDRPAKVEVAG